MPASDRSAVWLRPGRERPPRRRALGLTRVAHAAARRAAWVDVPGEAAGRGVAFDDADQASPRWYPQGVTGTSDPATALVSWYARGSLGMVWFGARLSVVTDLDTALPRYEHVLLARPRVLGVRGPARVHAGGLARYGDRLFVAASDFGLRSYRLSDVVPSLRWRGRGARFVLPETGRIVGESAPGVKRLRFSFVSTQLGPDADHLVVGEYGRKGGRHRLARFRLDRVTGGLAVDADGVARPVEVHDDQPDRMQGVTILGDTWLVSASAGEGNPGTVWSGRPGDWTPHRGVLPTGPEDLACWPERGEVWSVTEWPGRRWLYPVDAGRWLGNGS